MEYSEERMREFRGDSFSFKRAEEDFDSSPEYFELVTPEDLDICGDEFEEDVPNTVEI